MQGLELSRRFFEEYGAPMLDGEFADVKDRIAAGLCGEGSECSGFDDEISVDHDFEPGFCLFITKEDERAFGFRLERAYARLPKEYAGFRRQPLSPAGGNRHGVLQIDEFYTRFLGTPATPASLEQWLYLPPAMLRAASNGEVFRDPLGVFSKTREALRAGYPEDVRRKKIAAHTALMAQAGQYNYGRCIQRKETGAAQLAVFEFVKHAVSTVYLLNNVYEPFYKWAYKGMRSLPLLAELEEPLVALTELGNSEAEADAKAEIIEDIASMFIRVFSDEDMTKATCNNLDNHALSILDTVKDNTLRNMHIMEGA